MKKMLRKSMPAELMKVLIRLHYPPEVILLCVRWYVAYSLSLRNLEEMMAKRGFEVDHSTVHRWVIKLVPLFEKAFRKHKRPVGKRWRMAETYMKISGDWKYLYRAVDKAGRTVDFLLRAHRDKAAARRYFEKAIDQNGAPETVKPMKGFKDFRCARLILSGHRNDAYDPERTVEKEHGTHQSTAEQFYSLMM